MYVKLPIYKRKDSAIISDERERERERESE